MLPTAGRARSVLGSLAVGGATGGAAGEATALITSFPLPPTESHPDGQLDAAAGRTTADSKIDDPLCGS